MLPPPFAIGIGVFTLQSIGQVNGAMAGSQVFLMQSFNPLKMLCQRPAERIGQNSGSILIPFTGPDDDLMLFKINILNPQAQTLHQTQPTAIQQAGDQLVYTGQGPEQNPGLALAQNGG